jgi:hypothetical protein
MAFHIRIECDRSAIWRGVTVTVIDPVAAVGVHELITGIVEVVGRQQHCCHHAITVLMAIRGAAHMLGVLKEYGRVVAVPFILVTTNVSADGLPADFFGDLPCTHCGTPPALPVRGVPARRICPVFTAIGLGVKGITDLAGRVARVIRMANRGAWITDVLGVDRNRDQRKDEQETERKNNFPHAKLLF